MNLPVTLAGRFFRLIYTLLKAITITENLNLGGFWFVKHTDSPGKTDDIKKLYNKPKYESLIIKELKPVMTCNKDWRAIPEPFNRYSENIDPDGFYSSSGKVPHDEKLSNLVDSLREKLSDAASTPRLELTFQTCDELGVKNYIEKGFLRKNITVDLEERVRSLISIPGLTVGDEYLNVQQEMRDAVETNHELLILSALSENHFTEGLGLLKNWNEHIFPLLANFTLVIYDLGLTDAQKDKLRDICHCTVVDFPFAKLPEYFRNLRNFSWKVFIISAHFEQADLVLWTDSSFRVEDGAKLKQVIHRTRQRGVQQRWPGNNAATTTIERTAPHMFEVFGDSPCVFSQFPQASGGFGIYHR